MTNRLAAAAATLATSLLTSVSAFAFMRDEGPRAGGFDLDPGISTLPAVEIAPHADVLASTIEVGTASPELAIAVLGGVAVGVAARLLTR